MWILDTVGENIQAAVFTFLSAWSTFLLGCIEFFMNQNRVNHLNPWRSFCVSFCLSQVKRVKKKKKALFHFVWKSRLAAAQIINRLC